ncbi:MAG: sigma-70 family RNA polymerase sigma factor [Candidatus Ratteibacteria bacterium]|nr:sigma-70 family RNA polymerase sigma factor [Candidatus Ratteibacteria bacterium]
MNGETDKQGRLFDNDTVLVKAFQAGDKNAFDKLILGYMNKVFNLCYRFLGNYEEANDSAQETFIKVYRSLNKFQSQSSFSTWLYRIAVNTCKNRLKSAEYKSSRETIRIDEPKNLDDGKTYSVEIADQSLSPVAFLDRKESSAIIQSAIDSLSQEHKEVVVLRDIEGLSYEQIASITGDNLGTVKSKLARAREKLARKLKGLI